MKSENKVCGRCCIGNKEAVFKAIVIFLVITSIFVIFKTLGTYKANKTIGIGVVGNTVSFSGKGEVFVIPDIATFSFSSKEEAKTPAEAQNLSTKKVNKAIDYLRKNGVEDKDIKTINYNLSPRYEWKSKNNISCLGIGCPPLDKTRNLIGYEINQKIMVKVREVKKAGTLLAGIGGFGLNTISDLSFSVDDKEKSQREARKLAIDDAKNKAKELSQDLGVTLVKIVNFNESSAYRYPYQAVNNYAFDSLKTKEVQIPVGENKITSNIRITYEIR